MKKIYLSDVKYCKLTFSTIESPIIDKYVDFKPTYEELLWLYSHANCNGWYISFVALEGNKYYPNYLSMAEKFCKTNKLTFENISAVLLITDETIKECHSWFV